MRCGLTWRCCRRTGSLYGELARFVLRLLGYRGKQEQVHRPPGLPPGGPMPGQPQPGRAPPGLAAAAGPSSNWNGVWDRPS